MKRFFLILILVLLLSGCAAQTAMPPYVVMLTTVFPSVYGRCTAVALDEISLLTAEHCADLIRVVTQYGQETVALPIARYPERDLAILQTAQPLVLPKFAKLDTPEYGIVSQVWGVCPYFFPHTIRLALYDGTEEIDVGESHYSADRWKTIGTAQICGGDSGGVVVQNGRVVGITSVVHAEIWFIALGKTFYTENLANLPIYSEGVQ